MSLFLSHFWSDSLGSLQGADIIVKVHHSTLKICKNKKRLNLLNIIEKIKDMEGIWEEQVEVMSNKGECISGRLCIMKKDDKAIKRAIKRITSQASRNQRVMKPETPVYAKYIVLFTTVKNSILKAVDVL